MQSRPLRPAIWFLSLLALCLVPSAGMAKGKSCAASEALFAATGQGDRDGDGLSDCRERRQLHTRSDDADSDHDGVPDGVEVSQHSDPLDVDSDDDGTPDGDDDTPEIPEQHVDAFLDALTCPQLGVLGSIAALGITVTLDDHTEFEGVSCADLAAKLATDPHLRVEISILEDSTGALTARSVEVEDDQGEDPVQ